MRNKPKSVLSFSFCLLIFFLFWEGEAKAQRLTQRKVKRLFKQSEVLTKHFTGFALYSQDNNKMIYELNADKYFTPASNTKLFTFYTALEMLGDSIPTLRYIIKGDSLIFWGTGDPSFLHTTLKSDAAYHFLKNSNKRLFYSPANYRGDVYGKGWAWSDYNDYYQTELTALPLFNGVVLVYADKNGELQINPISFRPYLQADSSFYPENFTVERAIGENRFRYPAMPVPVGFKQEIPIKTSVQLTVSLLQDTLKKSVEVVHIPMPLNANAIKGIAVDSVYKAMLLPSDNFIAEQLLLVCSSTVSNVLHTDSAIAYAKKTFLNNLPDEPRWIDGSGLSRYNLFTPRSMVALLKKIWLKVGDEQRLHNLLPAGGKTGTLRNAYKTDNGLPFVWAKTGTLSNNHNQSGYLVTRKGRRLIYSFMNNNFVQPTSEVRTEMARIITEIHERF